MTLAGGESDPLPVRFRTADGQWRELATRKLPLWSGGATSGELVTLRDEHEIHAVRQAFLTVMACNGAGAGAQSEQELLEQTCRAVVVSGGYAFAWYGVPRHDEQRRVEPVAVGGDDHGYAHEVSVSTRTDSPYGQGPTGIALRAGTTEVRNDLADDPQYLPWRAAVAERGICSITLPVRVGGRIHGALMVYGRHSGEFGRLAQVMLEGLAADLGRYGLERLADAHRRREAEKRFRLLAENATGRGGPGGQGHGVAVGVAVQCVGAGLGPSGVDGPLRCGLPAPRRSGGADRGDRGVVGPDGTLRMRLRFRPS
ncbi:MAG: GAF domain-containing protein [Candidatus Nanopelagicales bacterium]